MGVAGCRQSDAIKTYPVKGKVVFKGTGEPAARLAGGYVVFELVTDAGKVFAQGKIEEDGTFALGSIINNKGADGALPGEYRVRVTPPLDAENRKPIRGILDPQFQSFDKSGIRQTIVAGVNDFTIEVAPPRR
jgi:hypothetical protein